MSGLAAMMYREARIRATNVTFIFWDVVYPLAYMLVFGVGMSSALGGEFAGSGIGYSAFFLAGVLGMASFGIASNTAWSLFMDRDNGIFYEMLTYPLSRAAYLIGKVLFNGVIALERAKGRHDLAAGPDVPGDEGIAAGCRDLGTQQDRGRPVEVHDLVLEAMQREAQAVRTERVREQDPGARVEVAAVDAADHVGMGEVPGLGCVARGQARREQHRPHRAVGEDGFAARKQRAEAVELGAGFGRRSGPR